VHGDLSFFCKLILDVFSRSIHMCLWVSSALPDALSTGDGFVILQEKYHFIAHFSSA
jgi:hypothetical protein